tara:strand:+ start:440 stop:562 length:123 start_codon:yes stop_codon:yes gene_type:complete
VAGENGIGEAFGKLVDPFFDYPLVKNQSFKRVDNPQIRAQ